ncbi:MAG TPA: TonB-dependent receptor [Steroidobacteraceae bacterium]|nr:TonB-dependent receptor [Steroidobacteraceae bacterium]
MGRMSGWSALALLASSVPAALPALALDSGDLAPIVVTATRTAESSLDLPVSIDRVDRARIEDGQLQLNLSESLDQVPGVSVENRQNYAQDLQLSVRGFGARSSFGVRGVRLYSDGIPGTMPDGQGQFSQFDLGSAGHIEVMRGPFSALYGNSSGGVIALFTQDGPPGSQVDATVQAGSLDTRRIALKAAGSTALVNYVVDAAHFQTEGYRDHSAAERENFNSRLRFDLAGAGTLTLIANAIQTPAIQDPLGLTSAQLAADPGQAGTNALLYNTRKSLYQEQAGAVYERSLAPGLDLTETLYAGHRSTTQFQAILVSAEATPTSPGGVIGLDRGYWGTDTHVTDRWTPGGTSLSLTAGISYDHLSEARQGFLNFIGPTLGVEGALRRDQRNYVFDLDEYLQAQWDPDAHWRVLAGLRHSLVNVSSNDFLAASGVFPETGVSYGASDPVAGVTWRVTQRLSLYGSYGRGFETPTLNDIAYRSVNGNPPGLNFALQPAHSDDYEVGIKSAGTRFSFDASAFYIRTHDELAVLQNSGGRSVYQNIGETQRRGAEVSASATLGAGFDARLSYTWIRAQVAQPYSTCITLPCVPQVVAAGSRLPAVPENNLYSALTWRSMKWGFSTTLEAIGRAQIYANDLNTQAASGFWTANLEAGLEQVRGAWSFHEFARIDNLANTRYVDSVIVNESNMRYFEPDPGQTFLLMVRATYR